MILLGIDGSLTATGLVLYGTRREGVVVERCIRTAPDTHSRRIYAADDDGRRVDEIVSAIVAIADQCAIDWAIIEAPAGSQSSTAAKALGLVYGACRAVCLVRRVPVMVVQAAEAKRVCTGKRDASKAEMVQWAEQWAGPIAAKTKVEREAIADARALVRAALESPLMRRAG